MQWSTGSEHAEYAQEARWWIPDADVNDDLIPVGTIREIMGHLRDMPKAEINRKLTEMQAERLRLTFLVRFAPQTIRHYFDAAATLESCCSSEMMQRSLHSAGHNHSLTGSNTEIPHVVEEMDLITVSKESSTDGMHWSIAPSLVEEST